MSNYRENALCIIKIIMKNFLIILLGLYTFSANTGELKRESSGFSETEEFKFEDNTVIHYKNKTTWKDNLGNYGLSNCLGLIVTDFNKEIIDYKMYCKYLDQDNHEYTHKYIRETAVSGGVGKSNIISGTGKWKKHIGVICTYAIDYLKTALFLIEKCNLEVNE